MERIQQYVEIEQEPQPKDTGNPPAYWPASGDLRVEKLTARYSPVRIAMIDGSGIQLTVVMQDGPKVLEDVSFHAQPGERVGIGKNSGTSQRACSHCSASRPHGVW